MTLRHGQKKNSITDKPSSGHPHIAHGFTWRTYAGLGILLLIIFYWLLPAWLNYELNTFQNNAIRPIAETLLTRRLHWIQWAGITLGLVCILFAIRNYVSTRSISSSGNMKFFNRLLAKLID